MERWKIEVEKFASLMREELLAKDASYGDSWKTCTMPFLLERLKGEVKELERGINMVLAWGLGHPNGGIVVEASHVANLALLIALRLKPEEEVVE